MKIAFIAKETEGRLKQSDTYCRKTDRFALLAMTFLFISVPQFFVGCKNRGHNQHTDISAHAIKYHCPMHPQIVADKAGDCPICGMRLVPVEAQDEAQKAAKREPLFYRNPMNPEITSPVPMKDEMGMDYVAVYQEKMASGIPGHAALTITSEKEQRIGVRVADIKKQMLKRTIQAAGKVAYDPELYSAIVEYKEALKARDKATESSWPDVKERAQTLVDSATLRLRQMGVSKTQITTLVEPGYDPTELLVSREGGKVWVYAEIYQQESGLVKRGQTMDVTSSAFPGKKFQGKIASVDSIMNPETRTLKVRGEVPNPEGLLKPEMWVDAAINVDLGTKLVIPKEAVMDTGERKIVYIQSGVGTYEPREVVLGSEADNFFEVVRGVNDGEKVVVSGNFLIDSESRIKAAVSNSAGNK